MYKSYEDIPKLNIAGVTRCVDAMGRVVIPKEFRRELGYVDYDAVEIFCLVDGLFIRKKETPPQT